MKRRFFTLLVSLVLVIGLTGCAAAGEAAPDAIPEAAQEKAEELSGDVIVDGSGTVFPLLANIAEEYMTISQPGVSVQVGRAGTSAGFKKFAVGELDFVNASRSITEEETAELQKLDMQVGEEVLDFKIAYDGLTFVINKENTWATELTKDEIIKMYVSGSFRADDKVLWSDIRPDWPAEEIMFLGPNENHGTFEWFYEDILGEQEFVTTANLQQEYSTLVDLVSRDVNAIAFLGFGYYATNQDILSAVSVDFGSGPVEPSLETIGDTAPYSGFTRPVYTYLNVTSAADNPQVLDFARFIMSADGAYKLAAANGFAPLPESVYAEYTAEIDALTN